jgi:thiamine-phosphate pyrophosphorylase
MAKLQSQADARRKLNAAARRLAGSKLPPALFFTDPKRTPDPVAIAAQLPAGWGVVYRHFGAKDRERVARELVRVCRRRRVKLLVAADPGLALKVGADGVHWPEARLARMRVRKPGWIETASAHGRAGLARAASMGVDAVVLSAVFDSASSSAGPPMGALRFRLLAAQSALPVYALGGISAQNAGRTLARFAAIDAVVNAFGQLA